MSPSKTSPPALGPVLVTGGCGFVGYHVVRRLLDDPDCISVHVVDKSTAKNRHDGATYLEVDIADADAVGAVIDRVRPRVVFHAASPMASLPGSRLHEFFTTNVRGTEIMLAAAAESEPTEALVFTSTVDAYLDPPHDDVAESHPLWSPSDKSNEYNRTKSIADSLSRAANGPQLRTAVLRLGHVYGEKQSQGLVEALDQCAGDKPLVQVGDGKNLMEVLSVANAAAAHVLVAKALLDPTRANGRVDGEAFNISDGAPVPFWHHIKVIWSEARGRDISGEVRVIPAWVMAAVVHLVGWIMWIFTFDTVKPPMALRQIALDYCTKSHTYSLGKARERLLFRPVVDHDAVLARSTRLALDERAANEKKG